MGRWLPVLTRVAQIAADGGKINSVNKLDTEGGITRGAIRSTMKPGVITLAATRRGLEPTAISVAAKPVAQ